MRGFKQLVDPSGVIGDGGDDERWANFIQHLVLWDFDDAGEREEKFAIGQRMVKGIALDERWEQVVHTIAGGATFLTIPCSEGIIYGALRRETFGDSTIDPLDHGGIGKSA